MMNKLVLDLYRRAHVPSTAIDPSNNMPYETTQFSADRFAELIVEECLSTIKTQALEKPLSDYYVAQIRKHFGKSKNCLE